MRVTVHIGSPKTGSTALHNALRDSSDNLAAYGAVYRPPSADLNHNLLAAIFLEEKSWPRTLKNLDRQELIDEANRNLSEIAEHANSGIEHVILSGEYLFHLPAPAIQKLARRLEKECGQEIDFTIVAYLGEPSTNYIRSIQQKLKASRYFAKPERYRYSFMRSINNWRCVESAELAVYPYRTDLLKGGCIVKDFAYHTFGDQSALVDSDWPNQSLSAESMVVLHDKQISRPPREDDRFTPEIRKFIGALRRIEKECPEITKPALRSDLIAEIDRNHHRDLSQLADEFDGFESYIPANRSCMEIKDRSDTSEANLHVRDILHSYNRATVRKMAGRAL